MAVDLGILRDSCPGPHYIWPPPTDHMWAMPKQVGDCCGFLVLPTNFTMEARAEGHGTWDFDYHKVLGIAERDTGSHYMNFIHLTPTALTRPELRSAEAHDRRMERAKTKNERKKARRNQERREHRDERA
jgi:hypothetical protein